MVVTVDHCEHIPAMHAYIVAQKLTKLKVYPSTICPHPNMCKVCGLGHLAKSNPLHAVTGIIQLTLYYHYYICTIFLHSLFCSLCQCVHTCHNVFLLLPVWFGACSTEIPLVEEIHHHTTTGKLSCSDVE